LDSNNNNRENNDRFAGLLAEKDRINTFIVVGYYTLNTLYEDQATKFIASLKKYDIPHHVEAIESLGCWYSNTGYKPTFLKKMLEKFPDTNIVYVDCDAEFFAYPVLFENLNCNVGVHYFDRSLHNKRFSKSNKIINKYEVLSGTIFLQNNKKVYDLIKRWEHRCQVRPYVWDQKSLADVLQGEFYNLPAEYCAIFDMMDHIENPVIVHYQASRKVRENKGKLKMKKPR